MNMMNEAQHGPSVPPESATNADELLAEMNKMPLFMTELEIDDDGAENSDLEALKALVYDGTPFEVATNFKEQGNACVKVKNWKDAREFYTKGLAVLKGDIVPDTSVEEADGDEKKIEDLDEKKAQRAQEQTQKQTLEEVLYVNRALCNLEMQNFGSTIRDCAATLKLNANNVKALYRSATACFRLGKLEAALDACTRAQELSPAESTIRALRAKIVFKQEAEALVQKQREQRQARERQEAQTLQLALKKRGIAVSKSTIAGAGPVDLEDAKIRLSDPVNADSSLSLPVLLLYPLAAESELLKAVDETESIGQWLDQVLPCPWDHEREYTTKETVECYMETVAGGLLKVGKRVGLGMVLAGRGTTKPTAQVDVSDGVVNCFVVPKNKSAAWITEWKRRKGK